MLEKYDLKKMLAEIKEDEDVTLDSKDAKVSQDQIRKLFSQKRKDNKP